MIGSVVDRSLVDVIASDRSELDTRIRNGITSWGLGRRVAGGKVEMEN